MKKFNTTAVCIPSKHYMVDLSERVAVSFSFNKNKEPGVKQVHIGDKLLYEGIV